MHHLLDTGLISISVEYLHFGGNKAEGRRQKAGGRRQKAGGIKGNRLFVTCLWIFFGLKSYYEPIYNLIKSITVPSPS